jgi:oxepin-CoA hydrolase/3-oxo-5,6-dehydrosuberyl-CoA semialdehyde dehydrogenase
MSTSSVDSFLCGEWQKGKGQATTLYNPSTEEPLAEASSAGLDLEAAVRHARERGGPALRAMTFAQRAELLRVLAKAVGEQREELIGLGMTNAGNTRSDAKFDIDGASATLLFYADLGKSLGEVRMLPDGEATPLGRSARLYGQHALVPREGVAVHINAFNFPAWGMAEKLAVALLAGMPVITKPATATALMAHRMVQKWVEGKLLPEGALQLLCGSAGDLLEHLEGQDVVAFTGSSQTAAGLRRMERLARENVHLNVEADSLNAAILGPDVQDGSEAMNLFLAEVVKEITQKTGQKCTAVRRIYAPKERLDAVRDLLVERLREVKVGNPTDEKVTMGPLATAQQFRDVQDGISQLAEGAELATGGPWPVDGIGAPSGKGYFVAPTLLVHRVVTASHPVNRLEVFGPVASLMPYGGAEEAVGHVRSGGGGLVSSVYSDDKEFVRAVVTGIAAHHGRITIGGEKVAGQSVPPGTVMPQLVHGGPGRAGGGEELGGMRGLSLYLQRTALQGPRAMLDLLVGPSKRD